MKKTDIIIILDFGSQYTQLIARRTREKKVYCEILRFDSEIEQIYSLQKKYTIKGLILSGGPSSVTEKNSPKISNDMLSYFTDNKIPILGICYGMQLIAKLKGSKVQKSKIREYGHTRIFIRRKSGLFEFIKGNINVWMSHGDSLIKVPNGFRISAKSHNGLISAIENVKEKIYCLQFHPEVNHTEKGDTIIENFLFNICKVNNLFKADSFISEKINEIRNIVGKDSVILGLSGGVDSSVAALLMHKAIGSRLICVHIDNGLMRKEESKEVMKTFRKYYRMEVLFIDASKEFLSKLRGIFDPEIKRKIIGKTFIKVFEREEKKLKSKYKNIKYLVQGTLYPDVIESVSFKGPSATIKSHHNVGGLPDKMKLKLIEPFRELFKDEVREIGKLLKLNPELLNRHPFPGPGLAVRILSDITREKIKILQESDKIYIDLLKKFKLYNDIWQAFAVLLPVQTVGVMGDERSYENVIALRAVTSKDGMTADFFQFDKGFTTIVSNEIINKVKGVNRVVYDISSKPPATIEWE